MFSAMPARTTAPVNIKTCLPILNITFCPTYLTIHSVLNPKIKII